MGMRTGHPHPLLRNPVRDRHRHRGSAALTVLYRHTPATHHFQPLPDIFKRSIEVDGKTYKKMKKEWENRPYSIEEMMLYDDLFDED